jgi:hypothetical protein
MFEIFLEGGDLDKAVHLITAAFALFLFFVSYRTYKINSRKRFLYVLFAFLFFSMTEILVVFNTVLFDNPLLTSVSHFTVLLVLALFFTGTVKK